MHTKENKKEELGFLNLLILLLSFYVLIALLVDILFKLPPEVSKLLHYIDNTICFVFLFDFILRYRKAENKLAFMKWGWIDLIASIPTFDLLRPGRVLRIIRVIRGIRAYRSTRHVFHHVFRNKIRGTLTSVSILAVLVLILSSVAILEFETAPNSNIKTAEDAIWWSYVTITTVGYGDKYPVTTEGRIIAVILITIGVGLFGTFTAFISSWFVKSNEHAERKKG